MKALKLYTGLSVIIFLIILTGCSDNITSPTASSPGISESSVENPKDYYFTAEYTLRPGETIHLNRWVTSIAWITAYAISDCILDRKVLFISSSSINELRSLNCSWKTFNDFMLEDLKIKNVSNQTKTIEVKMTGIFVTN